MGWAASLPPTVLRVGQYDACLVERAEGCKTLTATCLTRRRRQSFSLGGFLPCPTPSVDPPLLNPTFCRNFRCCFVWRLFFPYPETVQCRYVPGFGRPRTVHWLHRNCAQSTFTARSRNITHPVCRHRVLSKVRRYLTPAPHACVFFEVRALSCAVTLDAALSCWTLRRQSPFSSLGGQSLPTRPTPVFVPLCGTTQHLSRHPSDDHPLA